MSLAGILVFAIAIAVAIAFAWARGRKSPVHHGLRARPLLDADAQRAEAADQYMVDPQTTRDVLRALGDALEIDPGHLRLTDGFDVLFDMDPQRGFHQRATFETWLVAHYRKLPADLAAETVGDLVTALQRLPMIR